MPLVSLSPDRRATARAPRRLPLSLRPRNTKQASATRRARDSLAPGFYQFLDCQPAERDAFAARLNPSGGGTRLIQVEGRAGRHRARDNPAAVGDRDFLTRFGQPQQLAKAVLGLKGSNLAHPLVQPV